MATFLFHPFFVLTKLSYARSLSILILEVISVRLLQIILSVELWLFVSLLVSVA